MIATVPTKTMDPQISDFLSVQFVLSLATSSTNNIPSCASLCYHFIPHLNSLVFKSQEHTDHITNALNQPTVAGAIIASDVNMLHLKGLQFTGRLLMNDSNRVAEDYYKRFPMALLMKGSLYIIKLNTIKYSDNTPLLGKKLTWKES